MLNRVTEPLSGRNTISSRALVPRADNDVYGDEVAERDGVAIEGEHAVDHGLAPAEQVFRQVGPLAGHDAAQPNRAFPQVRHRRGDFGDARLDGHGRAPASRQRRRRLPGAGQGTRNDGHGRRQFGAERLRRGFGLRLADGVQTGIPVAVEPRRGTAVTNHVYRWHVFAFLD